MIHIHCRIFIEFILNNLGNMGDTHYTVIELWPPLNHAYELHIWKIRILTCEYCDLVQLYFYLFEKRSHPSYDSKSPIKKCFHSCPKLKTSTLQLLKVSFSHYLLIRKMSCFSYVFYEVSFYINLAIQMIYWFVYAMS